MLILIYVFKFIFSYAPLGILAIYEEAHKGLITDVYLTAAHPSKLFTERSVWLGTALTISRGLCLIAE